MERLHRQQAPSSVRVWDALHDGQIEEIVGIMPGDLKLLVQIDYLRQMFGDDGTGFVVSLSSCTRIAYVEYGVATAIEDLGAVAKEGLILTQVSQEQPLVLECVTGLLELDYQDLHIALDSGTPVTYQQVIAASELYWERWSQGMYRESP